MNNLKKLFVSLPLVLLLFVLLTGFAQAEGLRSGKITGDGVNVRKTPELSAAILTQLSEGTTVKVLDDAEGWFKISYDSTTGWVSADFISVKDVALGSGTITAENVNVRAEPSTDAEVLTKLDEGTKAEYYKRSGEWYYIKYSDGKFGWVIKDFFAVRSQQSSRGVTQDVAPAVDTPDEEKNEDSAAVDEGKDDKSQETGDKAADLITYAKKFLGVRYRHGGETPKGFDCSGFTQYVYKHFGINIERTAADQAQAGTKIKKSELKTGDLVFFTSPGHPKSIGHTGIYIGDGKFIHASSGSEYRVIISDLTSGNYEDRYVTARRYLE